MAFPRSIILKIAVVFAIGALSLSAQAPANAPGPGAGGGRAGGGGRGRGGPTYTPAAGAKDLKSVLFNWGWYMGMLRSDQERDLMMTLEYTGKGTVQVDGQPCNVTKYRTSISYRASGERIQYTGNPAQWPGVLRYRKPQWRVCLELMTYPAPNWLPARASATAMPLQLLRERMIRLWAGPQGAFKAAMAGTEVTNPPEMAAKPQLVPADVAKAGKTLRLVGERQARCFVPYSGRPQCNRDGHTRREVHARNASWSKMGRRLTSSPTATIRTGTIRSIRPRRFTRARDDRKAERRGGSRHHDDRDGNGTDVCRGARACQYQSGGASDQSASRLDCKCRRKAGGDGRLRPPLRAAVGRRTSGYDRKLAGPASCN